MSYWGNIIKKMVEFNFTTSPYLGENLLNENITRGNLLNNTSTNISVDKFNVSEGNQSIFGVGFNIFGTIVVMLPTVCVALWILYCIFNLIGQCILMLLNCFWDICYQGQEEDGDYDLNYDVRDDIFPL